MAAKLNTDWNKPFPLLHRFAQFYVVHHGNKKLNTDRNKLLQYDTGLLNFSAVPGGEN
jgi:hypothetical protein